MASGPWVAAATYGTMVAMPTPLAIARVVLVPDIRPDRRPNARIRHFKLARLAVHDPRPAASGPRFAHLRSTFD